MEAESNKESQKYPPKAESAPWLLFIPNQYTCKKKSNVVASSQTFYSISQGKSYIKDVDVMRGCNCWSTPQGWIFMQEPKSRKCCLWNPTTLVKVNVSSYKWNFSSEANCVISSSPLEPGRSCRLMCLDNGGSTLFVYDLESCKWLRHDIHGRPLSELFVLNGQFYCTTFFCKLAVIDLIPSLNVRVLNEDFPHLLDPFGRAFTSLDFFLDSCGEIFAIQIFFHTPEYSSRAIHMVVFLKDCSNETWNHVDQIGNKAFFLGPSQFAASCSANGINIKTNCIYFLYGDECCLYIFDMNEGTMQVDAPCPEFLYCESSTSALWIMPSSK